MRSTLDVTHITVRCIQSEVLDDLTGDQRVSFPGLGPGYDNFTIVMLHVSQDRSPAISLTVTEESAAQAAGADPSRRCNSTNRPNPTLQ